VTGVQTCALPILLEQYSHIAFAPHGVASRWAGWGGEVMHEVVRNINVIKAFWKTNYPKTEKYFDIWLEDQSMASFYQNLGEPVVLKAYIQLNQKKADYYIRYLGKLFDWQRQEGSNAWLNWNYTFQEFYVHDPNNILAIEMADPPKVKP